MRRLEDLRFSFWKHLVHLFLGPVREPIVGHLHIRIRIVLDESIRNFPIVEAIGVLRCGLVVFPPFGRVRCKAFFLFGARCNGFGKGSSGQNGSDKSHNIN